MTSEENEAGTLLSTFEYSKESRKPMKFDVEEIISTEVEDQWNIHLDNTDLLKKYILKCLEEQLDSSLFKKIEVIDASDKKIEIVVDNICGFISKKDMKEINTILNKILKRFQKGMS